MTNWFNYKGEFSDNFGIYIQKKNSFDSAERDISYQSVPGRNGDIIIDNGRYKNLDISYTIALLTKSKFVQKLDDLKNWLIPESSYYPLYDSYDPAHYRFGAISGTLPIEQKLKNYGIITLKFNCKPFRYYFSGNKIISLEQNGIIKNPEHYESLPYLKIFGNGDITLYINETAFHFNDIDEYVEIDSDMMNCFKDTVNLNNKMESNGFPVLNPGKNVISWIGKVSKVDIKPRWRTI